MSRNPLASLIEAEAELFRIGTLARRLVAEHPDLPAYTIGVERRAAEGRFGLTIHAMDYNGLRRWAALLGAEPRTNTSDIGGSPWFQTIAETEVDGVLAMVHHGGPTEPQEEVER